MLESTDTLWRYMKLSTFLLLLEGKAWFPSVASLRSGDPLESALGDDFYEQLWKRLDKIGHAQATAKWIAESRSVKPPDLHAESDFGLIRSEVFGKFVADDLAALRAAWCWFASDLESAAMWSVYGHQGIAVMTDRSRLQEALPIRKEFKIEPMRYVDRRPCAGANIRNLLMKDPDLILRPYYLKAIEYSHEREVRVIAHCPEGAKGLMVTDIDSTKLIREVVVSPLLPPDEAEAFERAVQNRPELCSFAIRRSSLTNPEPALGLIRTLQQGIHGNCDGQIDTSKLPPCLKNL